MDRGWVFVIWPDPKQVGSPLTWEAVTLACLLPSLPSPPLLAPSGGPVHTHSPQTEGPHVAPKPGVSAPAAEAPQPNPPPFWGRRDVQGLRAREAGGGSAAGGQTEGLPAKGGVISPGSESWSANSQTRSPTFGHIFPFFPQRRLPAGVQLAVWHRERVAAHTGRGVGRETQEGEGKEGDAPRC